MPTTKDPQITAFGAAVQAYGLKQFGGPQMAPMVKKYLEDAIKLDPTWEYPKKLLKEVSAK